MTVNQRAGFVPTNAGASLNKLALKNQLVAGLDNALETSLVNAGKEKQGLFLALFFSKARNAEHGTSLSHRFDDEHSGHHGVFGKMPGKLRFVCRHILENLARRVIIADFEQGDMKVEGTYVALRNVDAEVRPSFVGLKPGESIDVEAPIGLLKFEIVEIN